MNTPTPNRPIAHPRPRLAVRLLLALALAIPSSLTWAGTVLVLGDSLSASYGLARQDGWVEITDGCMATHMPNSPKWVNASVPGMTTAAGRTRIQGLLDEHDPDLVIVALGGNDGLQGLPASHVRENLKAIVAASDASGARVLVMGVDLPPNYGRDYRQALREALASTARSAGAWFVPMVFEEVASAPGLLQADGIHPSQAGQVVLAHRMWPWVVAAWRGIGPPAS